ncbi:MAG TPA: hypothetical protein VLX61_01275 [Anaerolineales bacterium]|nr:hypothetical protein [Anaerolineales bacterium]
MKISYLRWQDITASSDWLLPEDVMGLCNVETVGYLVCEDKNQVQLADSFDRQGNKYAGVITIPKPVILKRKTIGTRIA